MLYFPCHGGASFSCEIDLAEPGFANFFFEREDKTRIPFHVSVRPQNDSVILNAKEGNGWGEETTLSYVFDSRHALLRVDFDEETGITLFINDEPLHRATTDDFPEIDTVVFVRYDGAILTDTIQVSGASIPSRVGECSLTVQAPCLLKGWAFDPSKPTSELKVVLSGGGRNPDEQFIADRFALADTATEVGAPWPDIGLSVNLPGRIWQDLLPNEAVVVQVFCNGIPCGEPFELKRETVVANLELMAATRDTANQVDHVSLLFALEHIRFGGLLPLLSSGTKEFFHSWASTQLGLAAFLSPDTEEGKEGEKFGVDAAPPENLLAKVPSATELLVTRARNSLVTQLRANPNTDVARLLRGVVDGGLFSAETQRQFFLEVAEFLTVRGDFPALYSVAAQYGQHHFEPGDNVWYNSTIMPFVYMAGNVEQCRNLLWGLGKAEGWLVTPNLAWTVYQIINGEDRKIVCSEKQREEIIYAYMALIDHQAADYWGRTFSEDFLKLAAQLLANIERFSDYLRLDVESFLLRCYGLSQRFWILVDQRALALSLRMEAGRGLFNKIAQRAGGSDEDVDDAINFFEAAKNHDITRYRIELFGPSGTPPENLSKTANLAHHSGDLPEASLRLMASPSAPNTVDDNVVSVVRQAVRARFLSAAKAPYYRLQRSAGKLMRAISKCLDTGEMLDPAQIKTLMPMLRVLVSSRSQHLGLTMMVILFDRMLLSERDAEASAVLAELYGGLQNQPDPASLWQYCSGVRQALIALQRNEKMCPHPMRRAVLQLFGADHQSGAYGGLENIVLPITPAQSLHDTLVVIFSCKGYLDTRIETMRKGWLAKLSELAVPYIIVIGDGDGRLEGDIVHLDAPDDYEGLPQKTLKAIEWVFSRTQYSYMYKVDDDCFLNAEEFFDSFSYRKFDYYGRIIRRQPGLLDRAWHHEKSTSLRGKYELDKSPGGSVYADGGSGYVISRHAMHAVLNAATTRAGHELIKYSFMEDKLLGDLLALEKINVADEDYFVSVLRRTHAKAIPVSRWANGFYPSRAAGVKLIHLDTHLTQEFAEKQAVRDSLMPKKLWPTFSATKLEADSNALELVSDIKKLDRLNAAPLAVVACMRNERFILPHFLDHYRKLGVQCFLIADNVSDDGTLEYLADQSDVVTFSVDTQYSKSGYGVAWQQALLASLRCGRWSLMADADELLIYRGWQTKSLAEKLAQLDGSTADSVRIFMLDMYPKGPLSNANFSSGDLFAEAGYVEAHPFLENSTSSGPYSNSLTWTSALRHRLLPGSEPNMFVAQKIALLKYQPWMRLSAGLHYIGETNPADEEMIFAHFKYHAEFRRKALVEVRRGQHFNGAAEYRKYLALMSEGREVIYDEKISVPWQECGFVRARLT
ncbi:hypothetical protein GG851_25580 [Bordetella petrii]|nr:hypothetical protein [Bordetella petrii]